MKYLYIVCFILLPPILVLVLVGYCLYYYFKKENNMTHFKNGNSHLHTGHPTCFADLTAETIGFQTFIPDSDGTCSETLECVEEEPGSECDSVEDAWEALRQAEIDEAYNNLIHYESFDDASVPF